MERTNEAARAGVPLTADNARCIIRDMERDIRSAKKRKALAAFFATNIAGKLSPEAIAVYRAYAES